MHVLYLLCVVHRGLLNVSGLVIIHYYLLGEISKIEMDTKRKVLVSDPRYKRREKTCGKGEREAKWQEEVLEQGPSVPRVLRPCVRCRRHSARARLNSLTTTPPQIP